MFERGLQRFTATGKWGTERLEAALLFDFSDPY